MPMICRLFGHAATPVHHHNQGFDFSICERCSTDLIRAAGEEEWRPLPRGMRVVWRSGVPMRSSASEVALRMNGLVAPPRRHPRRLRPALMPAPRPRRERRIRSRAELVQLCGRLVLSGIADYCAGRWREPAGAPPGAHVIHLPAPRVRTKRRPPAKRSGPGEPPERLRHRC